MMMTCRYRMILAVGFVFIVVLPFVQKATKVFPDTSLSGREKHVPKPELSLRSLWSGDAARQFEAYFSRKVGFRGTVVKTINQLNFSLLGKVTGNMGTPIVPGENYWLYEYEYVRHYTRGYGLNDEARGEFVSGLKRLQDALEARGIAFVLVLSPSKPEIYPEHLPEPYRDRKDDVASKRAYSVTLPELSAAGVNVFDVHALFERLKPTSELLFARTGTHWNYYGSFLACREMLQMLKEEQGLSVVVPELDRVVHGQAIGTDTDLLDLLNLLWFGAPEEMLVPYPEISIEPATMTSRPNVLVVGDSFSFTLVDSLNFCRSVAEVDLLYYFKRHFRYPSEDVGGYYQIHPESELGPIDYEALDWNRVMLEKDLVILEINEIMLQGRGWWFIEHALKALEAETLQAAPSG